MGGGQCPELYPQWQAGHPSGGGAGDEIEFLWITGDSEIFKEVFYGIRNFEQRS